MSTTRQAPKKRTSSAKVIFWVIVGIVILMWLVGHGNTPPAPAPVPASAPVVTAPVPPAPTTTEAPAVTAPVTPAPTTTETNVPDNSDDLPNVPHVPHPHARVCVGHHLRVCS